MSAPTDILDLISVSEILEEFTTKPNFHRKRVSQEKLLEQAGIKSRMAMRSGRGYAHFISKRYESKLRAFLNRHVYQVPVPAKAMPAKQAPHRVGFTDMDVRVELNVLRTEVEVQTALIRRLLRALGESDVLHEVPA
jgi:hypothetical protein